MFTNEPRNRSLIQFEYIHRIDLSEKWRVMAASDTPSQLRLRDDADKIVQEEKRNNP